MKKLCILCLLLLSLVGCGSNESTVPQIEDYIWKMTTVQSIENDGQAIAHAPSMAGMPDSASEMALVCMATDGIISLADETDGQAHSGTYRLTDTNRETSIYQITTGDTAGMAVVSMTSYHDETQTPTLIISLGEYTINFSPSSE